MCDRIRQHFSLYAADAACKKMNFARAEKWTVRESFDIQRNYDINLDQVSCYSNVEWESCSYTEYTIDCSHNTDVFLSCTGNFERANAFHLPTQPLVFRGRTVRNKD